jgi:hypothetical protein
MTRAENVAFRDDSNQCLPLPYDVAIALATSTPDPR